MGAGALRANGTLFSPMDSKKRPSVPQRKQILAGGAFGVVKREPAPDGAEVHTFCTPLLRHAVMSRRYCAGTVAASAAMECRECVL